MPVPIRKRTLFLLMLAAGTSASLFAAWFLAEFHEEIAEPFLAGLDLQILSFIHAHDTPLLTQLAFALTFIGSPLALVPIILIAAALLWALRLRRDAALLILGIGGSGVLDLALKLHFKRVRPDVSWAFVSEHSFSFPSGHSVGAVVLYGMLTYLAWSHLRALWQQTVVITSAFLFVAGIGLSRVYLGVHYPTDIAAGYAVGLIWLAPLIAGSEYVRRTESRRSPDDLSPLPTNDTAAYTR
jgi:membrane-associated phospholipid phosphatase